MSASVPIPQSVIQARRHATQTGLIYVSDAEPGIGRLRRGKGFAYLRPNGRPITARHTLARIRQLAIPPAYTQVWICRHPHGHLQATGRDARRRKQYRYHPKWRLVRDDSKFARMVEFGERLPQLRRRLKRDLALDGLPRDKVLAAIVTLLDETLIRVGNEEYARANKSYGLTTLRNRHVKFLRDGRALVVFRGKSGRTHEVVLDDRRLARIIRRCRELPGQQLFQYLDDGGKRQPVDSGMVNDYLRDAMCAADSSAAFTAKDFRTWGATVRALAFLACTPSEGKLSQRAFNRCVTATARHVAESLGNTAAVCRKSYINPAVFNAWRDRAIPTPLRGGAISPRRMERIALSLLRTEARRAQRPTASE
jgi:DNA topoisomerase-1